MPSEIHNTNDQTCDICEGACDGGFLGWTKLRESGPPDKYPRGVQMPVELEELIYVPCGGYFRSGARGSIYQINSNLTVKEKKRVCSKSALISHHPFSSCRIHVRDFLDSDFSTAQMEPLLSG
ncbi:hypothetical protein ACFX2C_007501 [Malus domestica]